MLLVYKLLGHCCVAREVNEETKAAREQVSCLKQQREMQAKKRQEKLRAAFLKKQEEKKKQAKQKAQAQRRDWKGAARQNIWKLSEHVTGPSPDCMHSNSVLTTMVMSGPKCQVPTSIICFVS